MAGIGIPTATQQNRVRVGGSGFTLFTFGGQPITFCQQVAHTSPQPVGQGASAIQPMDEPYPVEIITPAAAGMGQLVLNMFELFGSGGLASKTWDRLGLSTGGGPFAGGTTDNNTSIYLPNQTYAKNQHGIFSGAVDIVDIFIRQATARPDAMQIVKYIRPLSAGGKADTYTEEYQGCVITNVTDGEQIEVGTLEVIKQITVAYRYLTRDSKPSSAFAQRGHAL